MDKFTFKELVDKYIIVIPMMQRDYAYGRTNETEKRDNFLINLKKYIADDVPHELDFIYGSINRKGNLELLDGQQRVTTLFLLHWYLSLIRDSYEEHHFSDFRKMMVGLSRESRFSYRTRYSSTDFCNALVNLEFNGISFTEDFVKLINYSSEKLSEAIISEKWFLPHWNNDPTIKCMLNMLDSIEDFFKPKDCRDYYSILTEKRQLTFNFLELDEFKLTDELYIKMNSRGKPLTRFENFKSMWLGLYDVAKHKYPQKVKEKLNKINVTSEENKQYDSLRDYVSYMIDSEWTDIFWNEWYTKADHEKNPNVDNMMLSFITNIAIFNRIVVSMKGRMSISDKDPLSYEISALMGSKDKEKGITLKYSTLIKLFCDDENQYQLLFDIIDYFNIFNNKGRQKMYLPSDFHWFSEKEAFELLAYDYKYDAQYEAKAKVFAYLKYLILNSTPNINHFKSWMRFVCNICSNSYNLDHPYSFANALAGINYLYDKNIERAISGKDIGRIVTLDTAQIKEESLKMQLSQNNDWNVMLSNAENNLSYFEGRLRYPLIECCSVSIADINNADKRKEFESYVNKISAIFPDKDGCKCENELIRAMLSKGNYLMYYNSNNSLLKNDSRDNSWRRFLKDRPNAFHPLETVICDERNFFKQVIDDTKFDVSNVSESLNEIAMSYDDSISAWRKRIINCPEILEKGNGVEALGRDRFIRWNTEETEYRHKDDNVDNCEIDLLSGKAINGKHAELFSLCKYYELKDKCFGKLGTPIYEKVATKSKQPYFYFYKDDYILIKVLYEDGDCFRIINCYDNTEIKGVSYSDVETKITDIEKNLLQRQ